MIVMIALSFTNKTHSYNYIVPSDVNISATHWSPIVFEAAATQSLTDDLLPKKMEDSSQTTVARNWVFWCPR
jgi:hypothetical protein